MTPAFRARRRADDFDRLVEAAANGTVTAGPVSAEVTALAGLAVGLRELPRVEPRASFSHDLRERLMLAAATELTPASAAAADRLTVRRSPASRRRERRLTVGIASLAIVGASAGTALASQGALPGETLYPVKRAIENVRAGVTVGDSAKGTALLSDAGTRLQEVDTLSKDSSNEQSQREISSTLATFADQATKASDLLLSNYQEHHDATSIDKLHDFAATSIDKLTALEPLLPATAKDALTSAAQALLTIDSAARNLCPTCAGGITSLPTTLLDPVAHTIDSLGAALGTSHGGSKGTTPSKSPVAVPSLPANPGPANVAPPEKPATTSKPSSKPSSKPGGKATLPVTPPTALPSTLGEGVDGVVKGVDGTVGGVLGTVGGVVGGVLNGVGGLLGGGPSTQP